MTIEPWTRETLVEGGDYPSNITVGVDVGKSVNSTVITGWSREKSMGPDSREDLQEWFTLKKLVLKVVDMIFHTNVSVSLTSVDVLRAEQAYC